MNIPIINNGDFPLRGDIFRHQGESDTLLICFGDVQQNFVFARTPAALNINALFIRNNNHIFYSGDFSFANTFEDAIDFIQQEIDKINPNKLILGGFSAGGFASLLFTPYLKPNHTIAFAPQTNTMPYARSKACGWEKYKILTDNWKHTPPTSPIHIYRCIENSDRWEDKKNSDYIKDFDNIHIYDVPGNKHGDSFQYFIKRNILNTLCLNPIFKFS